MALVANNNLEYLVTRLHARRSRMAEAERLDALCRLRTIAELGQALYPGTKFPTLEDFQRRLVQDLVDELAGCRRQVDEAGHDFIDWQLARFQVENMKTLLRGVMNRFPPVRTQPHLVILPPDQALNTPALAEAGTVELFTNRLPVGRPRDRLAEMLARPHEVAEVFLFEAALDSGYHQELLDRAAQLPEDESEIVKPLVFQEVNLFRLMLVVRGKFHHDLTPDALLPLRVSGGGVVDGWFKNLLAAPDVPAAAKLGLGIVLDTLPDGLGPGKSPAAADAAGLEALAWKRLLRLANSAFRRSHMGLGAMAGYIVLRRLEVANLITLSEGVRLGVDAGLIRARMIQRTGLEVAHV